MRIGKSLIPHLLAVIAAVAIGGCSVILTWPPEDHPCNAGQQCYEDYSCRIDDCILSCCAFANTFQMCSEYQVIVCRVISKQKAFNNSASYVIWA